MRRLLVSTLASGLLVLSLAGTALAAHCVNESKPDGAGQHGIVLIGLDGSVTFIGANPSGRLTGGFADVYLDVDGSGTVTAADIHLVDDTFLISNHSQKANPAQGTPGVLPNVREGRDPGGAGRGVGG
ncbi:MAG TPA: hypothetical protein VM344_08520 [Vitreimonas sp.]|nr:hypothetical protein [Vitreimonas sp.]